jgi:hypothetical protein
MSQVFGAHDLRDDARHQQHSGGREEGNWDAVPPPAHISIIAT